MLLVKRLIQTILNMLNLFYTFQKNKRQTISAILGFLAIAGIVLFISFILPPSEQEQQFFWGLSVARFAIAVLFFVFLLVTFSAFFLSVKKGGQWQNEIEAKLDLLISQYSLLVLVLLYSFLMITGTILLLTIPPIPNSLISLEPVRVRLLAPLLWSFLSSLALIVLIKLFYSEKIREQTFICTVERGLLIFGVFLFTFFFYEHFAAWIGWVNKTKYSYWNLLAGEFLEGRLYIKNPPANTHDLTNYNGRWYVPSPPLPAVLMMPLAYVVGGNNISTAEFSMFFGAVNAVIVFLILEQLSFRQWIKLSRPNILLLVLLFAFGTPHLWVSINGRFWFVSQILTVTFLALAILGSLQLWSPWMIGLCIGLAISARPNGLMTWPFVFAVTMQILRENGETIDLKKIFLWAFKSALPIGAIIISLFIYNYARFENFFDFGYVTIDGNPVIVYNAQTYGLFSLHYVPYNLKVMFLYLPEIHLGGQWPILPSGAGMSLFVATPALVYLFHRYENKLWIWGAWLAVLFNFLLLVSYHNTGMDQFGYRYILDVAIPLIALLSVTFRKKIPWHFVLMIVLSILINLYGANWFMNG